MKFLKIDLDGSYIIEHGVVKDNRGSFSRLLCINELKKIGHTENFVQVNHSYTKEIGTIRGLHFQMPPAAEIKIVTCVKGAVFDVIVDIRQNSSTFLQWFGQTLSEQDMKMVYIPKGFAHGFQTLKSDSELIYFHTEFYNPDYEGGLHYSEQKLSIKWPLPLHGISERDASHPSIDKLFKGLDI